MSQVIEKAWYAARFVIPEGLLRIYERYKWQREIAPVPVPAQHSQYRVMVTPAKHAGQGKMWSDALDKRPDVSARSVTVQDAGFGHDSAYQVSWVYATLSRRWQKELRETLRKRYTHILVEASIPPLGGTFGGNFRKQIEWMQSHGIKVGFIAHGSEIRLPSRHVIAEKWSPFTDPKAAELAAVLEELAIKNAAYYREFDVPAFVSTAGLKTDLPRANFLGLTLDWQKYVTTTQPFSRKKLVACHVSSHSVLKATTHLSQIMRKLEAEGWIEFREYSGISHEQVPGILEASDIVLDQFALGDYGVFACEGLASGRLVLSHVAEQVRAEIEQSTGRELPIPETTLESLEWRLRDISAHRDRYREIAGRGPGYVAQVHDGTFSAEVLYQGFLAVE